MALGVANVVSGLGTPAGELADAAHNSIVKAIIENKPDGLVERSLACYDGLGKGYLLLTSERDIL